MESSAASGRESTIEYYRSIIALYRERRRDGSYPKETGGIFICDRRRIEPNFTPETFRQRIAEMLLHGNYEETALEKLAREVALRPVHQTDPGKLAREVDVRPDRDNALVPDQKEHRYDGLSV